MVYHIRQRLSKLGGNSFYRDKHVRKTETFCGAPCTEHDAGWADRKRANDWNHPKVGVFTVCPTCKEKSQNP
jgi:hypothetical protein